MQVKKGLALDYVPADGGAEGSGYSRPLDRHLRPAQRHAERQPGQAAADNGDCVVSGGAHARRTAFIR